MREDPLIGQEIDGYRVIEEIGRGGMGIVYRAEDVGLARPVALKMIAAPLARDAAFSRRFRTEARALARAESPHITSVYALRRTEESLFIVMEYVSGGTLGDQMAAGPLGWCEARPYLLQMLTALDHAHSVGVIHRDIKPGNIMLTEGRAVKVTDFGLAKLRTDDPGATVTQGIAGTLTYMAPEQVRGVTDLDARCDIYAVGMTAYELLTGRVPFDRDAPEYEKMRAIVEQPFPPPSAFAPDVPEAVDAAVLRALEKDPERRYPTAAAFREALEAIPSDAPAGRRARRKARAEDTAAVPEGAAVGGGRRWGLILGGAAVLLALLAGAAWWAMRAPAVTPLAVASDPPGATVFLDGVRVGQTPLVGAELRGAARLRVDRPGFLPVDTALVPGDGPLDLRFRLTPVDPSLPAVLEVTSAPSGATVFVDGQRRGQTPLRLDSAGPGPLSVRVERPGYQPWEERVDALPAGDVTALAATLQRMTAEPSGGPPAAGPARPDAGASAPPTSALPPPQTGQVTVTVEPEGHVVIANDRRPSGRPYALPPGAHAVRCEHPRHGAFTTTVQVTAGEQRALTCYFEARVSVAAIPWGTVYLNGENSGRRAPTVFTLGPGTYVVSVEREGYRTLDEPRTITVEPGLAPLQERLSFRLEPLP